MQNKSSYTREQVVKQQSIRRSDKEQRKPQKNYERNISATYIDTQTYI